MKSWSQKYKTRVQLVSVWVFLQNNAKKLVKNSLKKQKNYRRNGREKIKINPPVPHLDVRSTRFQQVGALSTRLGLSVNRPCLSKGTRAPDFITWIAFKPNSVHRRFDYIIILSFVVVKGWKGGVGIKSRKN